MVVRCGRDDGGHPGLGKGGRAQAGPGRGRHGLPRAAPGANRRLPGRRALRPRRRGAHVRRGHRDPLGHRRPAARRGRADRHAVGRVARGRGVRRRRRRGPDRAGDPGRDRHPQRPPDRGAGSLARGHRASCRGRAGAARDRCADHRHPSPGRPAPADRRRGASPAARRRRRDRRVRRERGRAGHGLRRGVDRGAARIGPRHAVAGRRGPVRPGHGRGPGDRRGRLPRGPLPPRGPLRRARPDDRDRRPDRRPDHRRRGAARRYRGVSTGGQRLRRHRRSGPRRAGRPGGHRDHQCPPDRGARTLAGVRREARRHRARAARHHRPDRGPARAGGHPRPRRRGGQAAARE